MQQIVLWQMDSARPVAQPLWVSWVSGHPQNTSWGCRTTSKILKGNIRPRESTSQCRHVGIPHLQAAVKCTKRCVKSHKIAHETPQNRPPLGELTTPPGLIAGCGDNPFPFLSPIDAFDRCSWAFVWTGRKYRHPQFYKRPWARPGPARPVWLSLFRGTECTQQSDADWSIPRASVTCLLTNFYFMVTCFSVNSFFCRSEVSPRNAERLSVFRKLSRGIIIDISIYWSTMWAKYHWL